jgi:type I restriction enzyme S subunit
MTTTVRLRDVGATYGGLTGKTKADFGRGDASFVTFLEVINNTRLRGRALEPVRVTKGERQSRVIRGDLLFNGSSETPEEVALSAVVDFDPDASTFLNSFCFGFRVRPDSLVDSTYLAYFFRSSAGRSLVASLAQGATRYNIAKTKFLDVELALPPLERQREIVEALGDIDDLIAALERKISKKQAIKQGMMQQLLTGRTRLPGFTEPWREATVGDLTDQHRRTLDPRQNRNRRFQHFSLPAFDEGERPVSELGSAIDSIKFVVPAGAVLVSKLNPRIPRIWAPEVISANAIASTEFVVLTPQPGTDRSYLKWLLRSDAVVSRMKLLATGTTGSHARTHPRQVAAIEVRVPGESEQVSVAAILDTIDHESAVLRQRLVKARDIKMGMMQDLLTDRTRLPVEEPVA